METKENLKERLKHQVMERMDISRTMEDEEILELVQKTLEEDSHRMPMSISMRQNLIREIFHSLRRLDILQDLIEDADITEIMVNGTKGIFYEKAGRLYQWDKHFTSEEKLQDVIQQIAGGSNRMVNELHPIVDTRLPDGSRVNIVLKPIAIDGTALSIRRFPKEPVRMQTLIEWGSISMEVADFLKHLVCAGYNIFVSGGTGSGKTTFLNALSEFIPKEERVVTIEDSAELQLLGLPNLVRLESRDIKLPGAEEITIRDLIKSALRMRPEGIKIKKGKLKRKKKRIPIPHTFLQHILGNLIPLIRCEVVKIIEEADDLLSFFHSILHVEGILPINGICTQHSFPE